MRNFESRNVDQSGYNIRLQVQVENQNGYSEQQIGSRKKLFVHNRLVATSSPNNSLDLGGLTKPEFTSFLGLFNRGLYSQFKKFPDLYDQQVDFRGVARHKNRKNFEEIEVGTYFYNVDLSSAYWQILYRLNYTTEKTYDKYMRSKKHKTAKRFCVSFLARANKKTYNFPDGSQVEINCDTTVLRNVYSNVRKELYRLIQESINGKESYLEFNIDGVTVLESDLKEVKDFFDCQNLIYKTTLCRKLNDRQYLYGNETRNFINILKNK
jgi:hypothetical protein